MGARAVVMLVVVVGVLVAAACADSAGSSDEDTTRELADLKERLDKVDREVLEIQLPEPVTPESRRQFAAEVEKMLPRYEPIREDILALRDQSADADDPDVRRAGEFLAVMFEQRYDGLRAVIAVFEMDVLTNEAMDNVNSAYAEVEETNTEFLEVASRLNARYLD